MNKTTLQKQAFILGLDYIILGKIPTKTEWKIINDNKLGRIIIAGQEYGKFIKKNRIKLEQIVKPHG